MIYLFEIIDSTLKGVFGGLNQTLIKIFFAILIFLAGFILGKLLGRILYKFLTEMELNKFFRESLHLKANIEHILSEMLSYTIYVIALIAALEEIGVANIVLYLISATVILLILISFFLAIRDILPNFIAGLYLYSREGLKQGVTVEIDELKGEFMHIDLFHLRIKTKAGDILYIPNSAAAKAKIKIKKN
jgi:small conductance mechanosensitive channel